MTDQSGATPPTLEEIFQRAIALTADRLARMDADFDEPAAFDRGARTAGALIRIAIMAGTLRSHCAKEDNAHDAIDAAPPVLTEQDIIEQRERFARDLLRLAGPAESNGSGGMEDGPVGGGSDRGGRD